MPSQGHLNFGWIDGLFIVAYMLMLIGFGVYHSRRQKTIREYFLAGKHMSWIPIGLSLMAALNSGIDYLAQPSALIKFGIIVLTGNLTWLVLYPYAFYISMPLFRRLDVYSAYEYLERRFHVAVRCLAAVIFIFWRLGWMATALYVPCLAITTATGHPEQLKLLICVMGLVATVYTMLGGVKAVIWTEVIQFVVMFGGLFITMLVIIFKVNATPSEIWTVITTAGDPVEHLPVITASGFLGSLAAFFTTPITFWGLIIAGLVGRLTGYTSDQVMVQRFQTAKSIRATRQGFVITAISDIVWMTVLTFVGIVLVVYFKAEMAKGVVLPDWVKGNTDYRFPYFMSLVFPPGLTGPVIAAIVAASLSAIASAINSQSTVIVVDFYNRIVKKRLRPPENLSSEEQRVQLLISRCASIGVGIVATIIAMNLYRLGIIVEIGNRVIQTFTGPLLGIFWLGMFSRRANSAGVFIGGFVGAAVAIFTAFWLKGIVSWMWPCVFGLAFTLIIGYLASYLFPASEKGQQWNWFTITKQPLEE
jgi:sodium-coupled monocarboxylate transporter 8/12